MEIKILYEDKDILVIDKPAGFSMHGDGKTKPALNTTHSVAGGGKTLVDWILLNYPKMKSVGEPMGDIARPGIVHRLDKDTSGVLILAKTKKGFAFLKEQFQNRTIKKTYHAIVEGNLKSERGTISKSIGRSPNDFRKRLAGRGARGDLREAVTIYKVVKRFKDKDGHKFTYVEVYPKTGRTHQIRVHMKYINHPLVGDSLYNPSGAKISGINRLALHAKSISFEDLKGEIIKVEATLPKTFSDILHEENLPLE